MRTKYCIQVILLISLVFGPGCQKMSMDQLNPWSITAQDKEWIQYMEAHNLRASFYQDAIETRERMAAREAKINLLQKKHEDLQKLKVSIEELQAAEANKGQVYKELEDQAKKDKEDLEVQRVESKKLAQAQSEKDKKKIAALKAAEHKRKIAKEKARIKKKEAEKKRAEKNRWYYITTWKIEIRGFSIRKKKLVKRVEKPSHWKLVRDISRELTNLKKNIDRELTQFKKNIDRELTQARENADAALTKAREDIDRELTKAKNDIDRELTVAKENVDRELTNAKGDIDRELTRLKMNADRELTTAKKNVDRELTKAKNDVDRELTQAKEDIDRELTEAYEKMAVVLEACAQPENLARMALVYSATLYGGPYGAAFANALIEKLENPNMSEEDMLRSFCAGAVAAYVGQSATSAGVPASAADKLGKDIGDVVFKGKPYSAEDFVTRVAAGSIKVMPGDSLENKVINASLNAAKDVATKKLVQGKPLEFDELGQAMIDGAAEGVSQEAVESFMKQVLPEQEKQLEALRKEQDKAEKVANSFKKMEKKLKANLQKQLLDFQNQLRENAAKALLGKPYEELTLSEMASTAFAESLENTAQQLMKSDEFKNSKLMQFVDDAKGLKGDAEKAAKETKNMVSGFVANELQQTYTKAQQLAGDVVANGMTVREVTEKYKKQMQYKQQELTATALRQASEASEKLQEIASLKKWGVSIELLQKEGQRLNTETLAQTDAIMKDVRYSKKLKRQMRGLSESFESEKKRLSYSFPPNVDQYIGLANKVDQKIGKTQEFVEEYRLRGAYDISENLKNQKGFYIWRIKGNEMIARSFYTEEQWLQYLQKQSADS